MFKCHNKGHYANKCPGAKGEGWEWLFQSQVARRAINRLKRMSNRLDQNPAFRSIVVIMILSYAIGSMTYLAQVFVDTGANCNTISRTLFEQLINRELVSELIKGPETGVRINLVAKIWWFPVKRRKWKFIMPIWQSRPSSRVFNIETPYRFFGNWSPVAFIASREILQD